MISIITFKLHALELRIIEIETYVMPELIIRKLYGCKSDLIDFEHNLNIAMGDILDIQTSKIMQTSKLIQEFRNHEGTYKHSFKGMTNTMDELRILNDTLFSDLTNIVTKSINKLDAVEILIKQIEVEVSV